jgi:hypothetical protein
MNVPEDIPDDIEVAGWVRLLAPIEIKKKTVKTNRVQTK